MDPKDIQLPPGWHVQKSGGRPKKDAKFIAITLARLWLINHRKEKASAADRYILEKWAKHGVTDEAHIRSSVRRMGKGLMAPLNKVFLIHSENMAVALSPTTKKGWLWSEPLLEALPLLVDELPLEFHRMASRFTTEKGCDASQ